MKLIAGLILLLLGGSAVAQPVPPNGCTTTTCTGAALPVGYLSVVGNQLQNSPGSNVRPACTVFRGLPTDNLSAIRNAGFNCVVIGWRDAYIGASSTTWSTTAQAGMTFSNGNLTATSGASGVSDVRSNTSKSAGKFCWEVTASTIGVDFGSGLTNTSYVLGNTGGLGSNANGYGHYAGKSNPDAQIVYYNGGALLAGTAATSTNGERITHCQDFDAQRAWVTDSAMRAAAGAGAWNSSGACNPTVSACGMSTAGLSAPLFITYHNRATGVSVLNTAGPLAVALPAGFSYWDQASAAAPAGCNSLSQIAACVTAAQSAGLAVVFSHLGNEVPVVGSACVGRQQNGLWFSQGGSSGDDDGCGSGHNWSYAGFKANTVTLLQAFNGNPTVIGYELHNEPMVTGTFTGAGGGGGGGTGPFTISGGQIFDPNGTLWHGFGINIHCWDGPNVPVSKFRELFPKANFVRLACWDGHAAGPPNSTILNFVNSYTAQGIVVMVEAHYASQQSAQSVDKPGEAAWYTSLSNSLRDNHLAWFASGNELCNPGLTIEHQNVYNAVRNTGKTAPVILTTACGNPMTNGGTPDGPASAYNSMTEIVWDFHFYNWVTNGDQNQSNVNATLASIINSTRNYTTQSGGRQIPVMMLENGFNDYVCSSNGPVGGGCGTTQTVTATQTQGVVTGSGYAEWLWSFQRPVGCCAAQTDLTTPGAGGDVRTNLGDIVYNNMQTNGSGPFVPGGGGGGNPPVNWGGGGDTDIRLACSDVGAAVNAVNPGVILFCPGPLNNGATLLSGAAKP